MASCDDSALMPSPSLPYTPLVDVDTERVDPERRCFLQLRVSSLSLASTSLRRLLLLRRRLSWPSSSLGADFRLRRCWRRVYREEMRHVGLVDVGFRCLESTAQLSLDVCVVVRLSRLSWMRLLPCSPTCQGGWRYCGRWMPLSRYSCAGSTAHCVSSSLS